MNEAIPVLWLQGVRVVLGGREVLRADDFAVNPGEVVAVMGPNGSGKSTLLQVGALLRPPSEGAVTLFGERAGGGRQRVRLRRRTASVFGEPTLLDMPARANVETALRIRGVSGVERRRRAEEWLDRLGVLPLAGARPHTLSAGEAQRVSLARAFAVEPELLFLDEPFSSLDVDTRLRLIGELRELLPSQRTTALLATHDRSEALLLADAVVVLLDGRIEQHGAVSEVLARPRTRAVATFLGYSVLEREAAEQLSVPGLAAAPVAIPPQAVALAAPGEAGALSARVLAIRGGAGRAELVVDLGAPVALDVPLERIAANELHVGTQVAVRLDAGRVIPLEDAPRPDP